MNSRATIVSALFTLMISACLILANDNGVSSVSLEIGPEMEFLSYHEEGALKNQGALFGCYANMCFNPASPFSFQTFASFVGGNLRYDGQSFDGHDLDFDVPSFLANIRTLAGFSLGSGQVVITPFVGLGLRYFNEDLKWDYHDGYRRETTWFYTPIGLAMTVTASTWTYGARAEYDLFWIGQNYNRDVPLGDGTSRNVSVRQDTGYGMQASVFAQTPLNRFLYLTIEPFLNYWDINSSDVERIWLRDDTYYFQRMANQTWTYGIRIGVAW